MVTTHPSYNDGDRFPSEGLRKLRAYLKANSTERTQLDLADVVGIPIGTLNHIIHGRRRPNLIHAVKLRRVCEIDPDDWASTEERRELRQVDKRAIKMANARAEAAGAPAEQ